MVHLFKNISDEMGRKSHYGVVNRLPAEFYFSFGQGKIVIGDFRRMNGNWLDCMGTQHYNKP